MSEIIKDAKARAKAEKAYAKATRPWFKKKRFWALGLIAIIIIISVANGGDGEDPAAGSNLESAAPVAGDSSQESAAPEVAPLVVPAQKMIDDLESNALAASNKYEGKRVTVTGKLSNIDASGDYFSLTGTEDFTLTNVQIYIDESHLDALAKFTTDQKVTVTGKVTSVGEILGYSIDAETIAK